MMKCIFEKSNWMISLMTGVLFALLAASPAFADYSGRVASFKSEKNAVIFVHKMKAKGLVAYYQKEDIPGKGEFFRTYIGGYKTLPLAQKALMKLKKSGDIESFEIQRTAEKSVEVAKNKPEIIRQKSESAQKPEIKTEAVAQTNEPTQKSENKTEVSAQTNEPAQKPEIKTAAVAQTNEPAQKPESKTEVVAQTNEPNQKPENKTAPSIDTRHYYDGVKGIVLNNGRIIKGRIISIDDNDVLKIRTRGGRILSYSFTRDVKEYITEP